MVYTCLDNNRSSTHDRVIANADATSDNASVTNVGVFAYVYFSSSLCTLAPLHWPRIGGLLQRRNGHTSTDLRVPSYYDPARVEQLTARSKNSVVSNKEVVTIVAVERNRYVDAMTQMTGNLSFASAGVDPLSRDNSLEKPCSLTKVFLHSCIEAEQCLRGEVTLVDKLCSV
jgi:hypothetical protein